MEMQQRQLGDLAFLLQNYEMAFSSYHQVKRDFQSASTWLYYAGTVVRKTKLFLVIDYVASASPEGDHNFVHYLVAVKFLVEVYYVM